MGIPARFCALGELTSQGCHEADKGPLYVSAETNPISGRQRGHFIESGSVSRRQATGGSSDEEVTPNVRDGLEERRGWNRGEARRVFSLMALDLRFLHACNEICTLESRNFLEVKRPKSASIAAALARLGGMIEAIANIPAVTCFRFQMSACNPVFIWPASTFSRSSLVIEGTAYPLLMYQQIH